MRPPSLSLLRSLTRLAPLGLLACSSLIGLDELEKVSCVECAGAGAGALPGGAASGGGNGPGTAGALVVAGAASGPASGGVAGAAGTGASAGTLGQEDGGEASGGSTGSMGCPGGVEPPTAWTEHWEGHGEQLTRVYYDDCIALYFDTDVAPAAQDWLVPFLGAAWSYTLATYGQLGNERLYVVVHQGKFFGGHSATFAEASHDFHSVIDMGAGSWEPGSYDVPAHLLGFIADTEGAQGKLGAPKAEHYGNEGFPLIYKYDLYLALGLTDVASSALTEFNTLSNGQPAAETYWFRDWFYPLWRDHGHADIFANYMALLQQHYPTGDDGWMPTMDYGQYFHFMSGAAGQDLSPLAREAFAWRAEFDDQIEAAKEEFPAIAY